MSLSLLLVGLAASPGVTGELRVGPGEIATIQAALDAAQPGDVVTVAAGVYEESLDTVRAGTEAQPIIVRAETRRAVTVRHSGRVLTLDQPFHRFEGLIFDGLYGASDAVKIEAGGRAASLFDCEVLRSGRDCIDLGAVEDVTIEGCTIHHCLASSAPGCNSSACRVDAHGIVGGAATDLLIKDTEVHTFSGDAFQMDAGRSTTTPWSATVDGCLFWLRALSSDDPLDSEQTAFATGIVPGENAIDTKVDPEVGSAQLTVRDSTAHGFAGGLISNMAAFNIKEDVVSVFDRVTVHGSEIGFRLRGSTAPGQPGAKVEVRNMVTYDVAKAFRLEDDIQPVLLSNLTFGNGVIQAVTGASLPGDLADVIAGHNLLFLAEELPAGIEPGDSILVVGKGAFVDADSHDYHLAEGALVIDAGEARSEFTLDRDRIPRPQGAAWDVGAYEYCPTACVPVDDEDGLISDQKGSGCNAAPTSASCFWMCIAVFLLSRRQRLQRSN